MKEIISQTEERMKKAIASTQRDFASIRTGRANAALLDRVTVEYYGADTQLKSVGNVTTPDARTIQIQLFERNMVKAVEKAIMLSDLGITPATDGQTIRLTIPALTEERRKEFVKQARKATEEGKVAVRNVRRDGTDSLKKAEKAGDLTEDERKRGEDQIQKLTDRYTKELDELLAGKEKEIMEV